MDTSSENPFSGPVTFFHGQRLPEMATPAGYSALIDAFDLQVPLPRILHATGSRHRTTTHDDWVIMTPRHAPKATFAGHMTFALKYEGLDLAVLKRAFESAGPDPVERFVTDQPTGSYARRVWFLYEWLTGTRLNLPDADAGRYVEILDPDMQWGVEPRTISRQRVKNNLPGTPAFCPLVFKTPALRAFADLDLAARARALVADVPRDLLARTAAFLLLKDSQSTYAIEGERAPHNRVERWGRAIGEAGGRPLDEDELVRLQEIVIEDSRFVTMGFRQAGGFVGAHDRTSHMPLPEHISAKPEDVPSLVTGLTTFAENGGLQLDPVIAAASVSFGFVYIHPFEDGNGRIHRYLIPHVLARGGFNPTGVVFPVSSAILDHIDAYRTALETYSKRLLPVVQWDPTPEFNVRVLNDTLDFYRYFDATPHAEFLFECVRQTVETDLPAETRFVAQHDAFRNRIHTLFDMPDRTADLLFRFLYQNNGVLSTRAKNREFSALTNEEVQAVQDAYLECFGS